VFDYSGDDHEFYLPKKIACVSKTIETSLSGAFQESSSNSVRLQEINSIILEKVIQYLHYKSKYTNSTQPIPEFPIEPEIVTELLMAANFLDC